MADTANEQATTATADGAVDQTATNAGADTGANQPANTGTDAKGGAETGATPNADLGNTLLTSEEGGDAKDGKPGDAKEAADAKGDTDPATVPETPDGYTLTFAEDTPVDTALLAAFKTTAHGMGLTHEQASGLASMFEAHAASARESAQESAQAAQIEAVRAAEAEWIEEIKADPKFEETVGYARLANKEFGSPELTEFLNQTRVGSHPAMVRYFARIGRALSNPGFKGGSTGGGERSAAEVLYPNHNK